MSSQPNVRKGRVSSDKIAQLNRSNPTRGNRFEVLSGDFNVAGGRNLVQQKLTAFAPKRGFDQVEDGGPASSPKRVAASAAHSYAQKVAGGGGGGHHYGQGLVRQWRSGHFS